MNNPIPHLILRVELDLEQLGAVDLAPCALADDLGGEHEVLRIKRQRDITAAAANPNFRYCKKQQGR